MRGRYLIYTPVESSRNERLFDSTWSKFADLCRSLNRDGLVYSVEFNLTAPRPHVLIVASGNAKPRRQTTRCPIGPPPPVPAARCRERALEAAWFLPEFREKRKDGTAYWRTHQARFRELSGMVEEHVRAEHEYWRELEALSGQREHFKPGRTDETARADDEVAA
jgi:hypothetical protein